MYIFRNDKVMLVKEVGNLNLVGEIYEVANITNTSVIIRDVNSKVAICSVDINDFEKYFKKPEEVRCWTKWQGMLDRTNSVMAYYRTNGKKVQVKTPDGVHAEAACNKCDEFNLAFGVNLAYARCLDKCLKSMASEYESALNKVHSEMAENKNRMKKMIRTLDE